MPPTKPSRSDLLTSAARAPTRYEPSSSRNLSATGVPEEFEGGAGGLAHPVGRAPRSPRAASRRASLLRFMGSSGVESERCARQGATPQIEAASAPGLVQVRPADDDAAPPLEL